MSGLAEVAMPGRASATAAAICLPLTSAYQKLRMGISAPTAESSAV